MYILFCKLVIDFPEKLTINRPWLKYLLGCSGISNFENHGFNVMTDQGMEKKYRHHRGLFCGWFLPQSMLSNFLKMNS